MKGRDLLSAAAGAVVAIVLAGGVAWAAIPSAGGVINGCYQKVEGLLRVIDPGSDSCRSSEVAIGWNERGVQGVKGDNGDPERRAGTAATAVTARASPSSRKLPVRTAQPAV